MSTTICLHHKYGHCKYGVHCRNQHISETCTDSPCITTMCRKRHPKLCRFFAIFGSCKFNESCSYLHKHERNEENEKLKKEIKKLKDDIVLLTTEVNKLKQDITSLSKSSFIKPVPDPTPALDIISPSNTSSSLCFDTIPQLDGLQEEYIYDGPQQTYQHPLRCETCGIVFPNTNEFKEHDSLQFCCDDCGICYATKLEADFHELKVHPDETYARNFIPESTKLLFTKQSSAVS